MVDNDTMNHRHLMEELVRHCKQKASGTIFFNLPTGESARLVLHHGSIHWVAYEQQRGEEAIDSIRRIDSARFNFNPKLKLAIGEQQLPPTSNILKQLCKHNNKAAIEPDRPAVKKINLSADIQDNTSGERFFDQDKVRSVLEEEALEYLGPMARILCSDYMKSMPPQVSLVQVRLLMTSLKKDIKDEKKGQLFMQRVKAGLNI
jgi:hypothetical protein